jgi:hypothetical protein
MRCPRLPEPASAVPHRHPHPLPEAPPRPALPAAGPRARPLPSPLPALQPKLSRSKQQEGLQPRALQLDDDDDFKAARSEDSFYSVETRSSAVSSELPGQSFDATDPSSLALLIR